MVGTDEAFFEGDESEATILDLYNENAGILEGDDETEVDLSSYAYQIWKNAIEADATLQKTIPALPSVVYSKKRHGGLFDVHEWEEHNPKIAIADNAFEKLFDFFDAYSWHLDERPLRNDNEINPDVLGYIFEKYVNQKQMGAYKRAQTNWPRKAQTEHARSDPLRAHRYFRVFSVLSKGSDPFSHKAYTRNRTGFTGRCGTRSPPRGPIGSPGATGSTARHRSANRHVYRTLRRKEWRVGTWLRLPRFESGRPGKKYVAGSGTQIHNEDWVGLGFETQFGKTAGGCVSSSLWECLSARTNRRINPGGGRTA